MATCYECDRCKAVGKEQLTRVEYLPPNFHGLNVDDRHFEVCKTCARKVMHLLTNPQVDIK